jgi:hypothetical protein
MYYLFEGSNWHTHGCIRNEYQPKRHFHYDAMCSRWNASWRIHFIIFFILKYQLSGNLTHSISLLFLHRNRILKSSNLHIWTENKNHSHQLTEQTSTAFQTGILPGACAVDCNTTKYYSNSLFRSVKQALCIYAASQCQLDSSFWRLVNVASIVASYEA